MGRIAVLPLLHVVVVELLRPDHPCQGLTLDRAAIGPGHAALERVVERIGLGLATREQLVHPLERPVEPHRGHADHGFEGRARLDDRVGVHRQLGPVAVAQRLAPAVHDRLVDPVLVGPATRHPEQPLDVGVVVAEQRLGAGHQVHEARRGTKRAIVDAHDLGGQSGQLRPHRGGVPRPHVAEPHLGEQVERRGLRAAIGRAHPVDQIAGRHLYDVDHHVEVALIVEHAGVDELVLGVCARSACVVGNQLRVGEFGLGILVEHPRRCVRRHRVEVVVQFLDVLTVVALAVGQAEQSLLEDRIALVPQGHRDAQPLLGVAPATDAVLAPAICTAARVIVRQGLPGGAVRAVVLAHRAPLALGQVRAPALPRCDARGVVGEASSLDGGESFALELGGRRRHVRLAHGTRCYSWPQRSNN